MVTPDLSGSEKVSKNNDHMVAPDPDCDHVTVVTEKKEKKIRSEKEGVHAADTHAPDSADLPTGSKDLLPVIESRGASAHLDGDKLMWTVRDGQPSEETRKWFDANEPQIIAELQARDAADQENLNP